MSGTPEDCPTSERLASFVEGRLEAQAREEMIRHLDVCPPCREIAAESTAVLAELGVARTRTRTARWAYAAAAVAVALLGAALFVVPGLRPGGGEAPSAARYLEQTHRFVATRGAQNLDRSPARSYGFHSGLGPQRAAFRIGSRLITLEARGAAAGPRAASEIAALLALFDGADELVARYDALAAKPDAGVEDPAGETIALVEARGQRAALALGAWTMFNRLRLAAGETTLDLGDDARLLREQLTDSGFPIGAGRTLGEIESIAAGDPSPRDVERVSRLLDDLIDMM